MVKKQWLYLGVLALLAYGILYTYFNFNGAYASGVYANAKVQQIGSILSFLAFFAVLGGVFFVLRFPNRLVSFSLEEKAAAVYIALGAITLIGGILRFWNLSAPDGMHVDESCALYNGWCISQFGTDYEGRAFPVYFVAWGGGQSAMLSYLTALCIRLFGNSILAVRIPMAFCSMLAIPAAYGVGYLLTGRRQTGLIAAVFCAFCPYYFMIARWGLDCNLLPCFLLYSFYFLLLAVKKNPWFYLASGAAFGLTLYTYALSWLFVPLFLLGVYVFLILTKRIRWIPFLLGNVILLLFALPLLCFVAVNLGILDEFQFLGVFSVSRLVVFRGSEIGVSGLGDNFVALLNCLFLQSDELYTNHIKPYGAFFLLGGLFAALGVVCAVRRAVRFRCGEESIGMLIVLWSMFVSVLLGLVTYSSINHSNFLWPCYLCLAAVGADWLLGKDKRIALGSAAVFVCLCALFYYVYFAFYSYELSILFHDGLSDATSFALSVAGEGEQIKVASAYAPDCFTILWQAGVTPEEFLSTVEYVNPDTAYRAPMWVTNFFFRLQETLPDGSVYLIHSFDLAQFPVPEGYQAAGFGFFYVYYPL